MKEKLVFSGLAAADLVQRYPRQITAALAALMLAGAGGAYAVASLAPAVPTDPLRLVTESVDIQSMAGTEVFAAIAEPLLLYRTEPVRSTDSPEALLQRLGVADPGASSFLRRNETAWKTLFSRSAVGRDVTVQVNPAQELLELSMRWVEPGSRSEAQRLVVRRVGDGDFAIEQDSEPLVVTQRLASGVVHKTLLGATEQAGLPVAVTHQLMHIFKSEVDFERGLHRGDRFSLVYEVLAAGGEALDTGRVLSAEFVNRGRTHQAVWFEAEGSSKGDYYAMDGRSLDKTILINPLDHMRATSGFGMRRHPVLGTMRGHSGTDFSAPTGTPVKVVSDGTVEFAGVQRGYGKVVYVRHGGGSYTTVYAHLSQISVDVGDRVVQGERIGAVGATGMATGPNLHFEYRDRRGVPQDPMVALAERRDEGVMLSAENQARFAELSGLMERSLAAAQQVASINNFE